MFRFPVGYRFLQLAFIIIPIVAGLDKFFNLLTDWSMYLSPFASETLQAYVSAPMMVVGVVEIIAGIGNMFIPKLFGFITAIWLLLIVANLVMLGQFYDIAARDFGLFLCAFGFALLSFRVNRDEKIGG